MEKVIQTTLCYIERDGNYLMLYRNKKKQDLNEGKWVGVGGKFEKGETAEMCMKREVMEETGLTVTAYRYCGVVRFISDTFDAEDMHLFTVSGFSGSISECDEGELAWMKKEEVYALPMWEGDRFFLDRIRDGDSPFFHMTLEYCGDRLVRAEADGENLL